MATITSSQIVARVQVVDCTQDDPGVERYMNVQQSVDGSPVGEPNKMVPLKTRPLSSFASIVALSEIGDDDVVGAP